MLTPFEQYKASQQSAYAVITKEAYDQDEVAQSISSNPRLIQLDKYVILSLNKKNLDKYYEHVTGLGFVPIYEFIDNSGQPMLLTHTQAIDLVGLEDATE